MRDEMGGEIEEGGEGDRERGRERCCGIPES